MPTHAELVTAATALQGWVERQRASWPASTTGTTAAGGTGAVGATPLSASPMFGGIAEEAAPRTPFGTVLWTATKRVVPRLAVAAAVLAAIALLGVAGRAAWARFNPAAGDGTALFESLPAGSQVIVDGTVVGSTPVRTPLRVGRHVVEFRDRNATRAQAIQIARGREARVYVDWNPRRVGRLRVTTEPAGAHVIIDGRDHGATPVTIGDLTVGPHNVVLESDEGSLRRHVDIVEGQTDELTESIFAGWLHVTAPIEITVSEAGQPIPLDDRNRVLLKPGEHDIQIENRDLGYSEVRKVSIEPGATATVSLEPPFSTLSVTAASQSEVTVDGVDIGETPITNVPVKMGTRTIVVTDRIGNTRRMTITVTSRPVLLDVNFTRP